MARLLPLLLVLLLAPLPAGAAVVRLAAEAAVPDDEVSLGEVATVEADEPLASRLRAVRLGPAPAVGAVHRVDAEWVRLRLRGARIDPARVRIAGAERVLVTRAFQVVPGAALVEAVTRLAAARAEQGTGAGDGGIVLQPLAVPEDLRVPLGTLSLEPRLAPAPPGATVLAAMVTVRLDGRDHQSVPLTLRVARHRPVLVAARPLEPRRPPGPDDLRLEPRLTTEIPADALTERPEAADLEVVRPVRAGEIVTARSLRPRLVVRRGELVTLVLESGGLRITAQGQAGQDGRRGDPVRVTNLGSRREVLGVVEAPGLVRVPFRSGGGE